MLEVEPGYGPYRGPPLTSPFSRVDHRESSKKGIKKNIGDRRHTSSGGDVA